MRAIARVRILVFGLCLVAWTELGRSQVDPPREKLRRRLENAGFPPEIQVGDELVLATDVLPRFYESRGFELAWDGPRNASRVDALLETIRAATFEGLDPNDYHLARIEAVRDRLRVVGSDAALQVDLDLLCTDAFLVYAAHLVSGFVDPETIDPEWSANRREVELMTVLRRALESGEIAPSLKSLLPHHAGYTALKQALVEMRALVARGGWGTVDAGAKLEVGVHDARVSQLRSRLLQGGDFDGKSAGEDEHFDTALRGAVVRFQQRHGLDPDGVVGPATLAALNVPARQRVRQVLINLDRWRWLPQDLGSRYVLVNVPAFLATVIDDSAPVLEMRVVVGRQYRRTPVFSARLTYIVLSPYWEVPPSIAAQDKLPEIRKDPDYLQKQGMRVYSGWGAEAREIDPHSIDWSTVSASAFPYRLRQDPGPLNALGRIKFMFPNKHNVYLHDTPQREHFLRAKRSFSSGCIRIEKPLELAAYLLADDPNWPMQRIRDVVERHESTSVTLQRPLPVHLLYWTTWVDESGTLFFFEDVYGRDEKLSQALRADPPDPD